MNNQSFITRLILKTGLAKNEASVPFVLIAIAVLALVLMFVMWPSADKGGMIDTSSAAHPINQ